MKEMRFPIIPFKKRQRYYGWKLYDHSLSGSQCGSTIFTWTNILNKVTFTFSGPQQKKPSGRFIKFTKGRGWPCKKFKTNFSRNIKIHWLRNFCVELPSLRNMVFKRNITESHSAKISDNTYHDKVTFFCT